ncbi:MAG: nitroreductase family protein [Candidatus Sulfotelmatobacter sp.]
MSHALETIFQRRAVRAFEPVAIPAALREQILNAARCAPSSFNSQPYRFYWVESPAARTTAARLCMGQKPAETASALVVAVADIGSLRSTTESQLDWMRQTGVPEKKIAEYETKSKIGRLLFLHGWLGIPAALKWSVFRLLHLWMTIGMPPLFRHDLFKWATKNASLACENLMIAAEALGLNTCPMEGFDGRRLSRLLGLSVKYHEIVMVIALGKRSAAHVDQPQWRRPLEATVTVL